MCEALGSRGHSKKALSLWARRKAESRKQAQLEQSRAACGNLLCGGEIRMVEAADLGLELGGCGTPSWGPGFAFVCILQLWDNDLGALWACPMDKCEYYKNCPCLYWELES